MLKYLRVRPCDFVDRQQQSSIEILDLYSLIIKDYQIQDQLKHILIKDTYEFNTIFKTNITNMDMYTALIQYNVDSFIELNSFKFLLKGDQRSGRTHCLIGMPQDPGLLLLFVGHLFYRLEELKKFDTNSSYQNRYNYKVFLKCYTRQENQYFDLLTNCNQPLVDFESVISFDSQLTFLKLLRIILKNSDQRKFQTAKQYHLYQQNQGSFHLDSPTFDFILERTSTTWYGTQEIETAHFTFEVIDIQNQTICYSGDRIIYFLNPAQKYINSTKIILRDSKFIKIQERQETINLQIIKNKLTFVLKSVKLIKNIELQSQLQQLIKQFKKEIEKLFISLDLKADIIEQVQQQVKLEIQTIGKVIISVDVREFLLSKFLLYQVEESYNNNIPYQEKIQQLLSKIKKLKKINCILTADYQSDSLETRIFKDIKINLQEILTYSKDQTYQQQHRAQNYVKLKQRFQEDFIDTIENLTFIVQNEQQENQLPIISQKNPLKQKLTNLFLGEHLQNDKGLDINETLKLLKQTARSSLIQSETRSQLGRLKTEKTASSPKLIKLVKLKSPRSILLQSQMFVNTEKDNTSIHQQFKSENDYKKLKIMTDEQQILNTMSLLNSDTVQNIISSPNDIIRKFNNKVKLNQQSKHFKIPSLSTNYMSCVERMVNLDFKK